MPTIMRNGVRTNISVEEYNETLAKYRTEVLGIDENTGKLKHLSVDNLGKVWINGQEFNGVAYQGLLSVNTKTYVEEPTRANDGSIPNINDYDTFVVPRCEVNFKYFSLEDYQRLSDAIMSNEFTVKYWDKRFSEFVIHKMYCEPEEMVKLYNVGTDVFGVLDYKVSFIGTLNDLQEFSVIYNANGGTISGNPTLYNQTTTYTKGDKVYLEDGRYFEAIWYENTFKAKPLTDTAYWKPYATYKYESGTTYAENDIVYEEIKNNQNQVTGRKYYLSLKANNTRPLSDIMYWQLINVKSYSVEVTYTQGQYVVDTNGNKVYKAIYYVDTFSGKDPTNTTYWKQLALGTGLDVKWGNSIVVADPESLFDAPSGYSSNSWNTQPDGSGYTYYLGQSLNVFKNLTLYAQWVTK